MGGDGFVSAVDMLRVALEDLEETCVTLQKCEDLAYGDPFIDEALNEYVAARYCDSCEQLNLDDDLKDKADRELIDARNKVERVLGALLARYDVHAVVELHRIEVDGVG